MLLCVVGEHDKLPKRFTASADSPSRNGQPKPQHRDQQLVSPTDFLAGCGGSAGKPQHAALET
jgi:hypothetical protein